MTKITVVYVGSSLPGSLRRAERELQHHYGVEVRVAAHNAMLPWSGERWLTVEADLADSDLVFVVHVTDSDNAQRLSDALEKWRDRHRAVIAMNCMGALMRRTRLGSFDLSSRGASSEKGSGFARSLGTWMSKAVRSRRAKRHNRTESYLKMIQRAPRVLKWIPSAGKLGDIKNYITLYCYFLQPTPDNITSMLAYAMRHYADAVGETFEIPQPESKPTRGIWHPDAPSLFASFEAYRDWSVARGRPLEADNSIGLLLLRPQILSGAASHYAGLIAEIESQGLDVVPVISTFMDNREACDQFLRDADGEARVSQLVSLTGFSFVGGPAMNDSEAAVQWLSEFNRPLRSAVSLEMQGVENWRDSRIGLNPVQTAMQVAIPEIDGATEPFVFGGFDAGSEEPAAIGERCRRMAARLARWNRLQRLPREEVKLALMVYCFPPNKGNLGTAADLDVFPSLWRVLRRLETDGYSVEVPESANRLRERVLGSDGELANVADTLPASEYYRLCPWVDEIESEWGPAPGEKNTRGGHILIHGLRLGNVLIAIQPTFGYEGDPMRLLMSEGGTPHHGFMGVYTYLSRLFRADALVHVGTHGALEFMPGKQVGLSERCWPDRLIGEFPNLYIYSVNNPSEGSIARRRSYAGLVSYLTPPVENAGLYKELAGLKELIQAYRESDNEQNREKMFPAIASQARSLHL